MNPSPSVPMRLFFIMLSFDIINLEMRSVSFACNVLVYEPLRCQCAYLSRYTKIIRKTDLRKAATSNGLYTLLWFVLYNFVSITPAFSNGSNRFTAPPCSIIFPSLILSTLTPVKVMGFPVGFIPNHSSLNVPVTE